MRGVGNPRDRAGEEAENNEEGDSSGRDMGGIGDDRGGGGRGQPQGQKGKKRPRARGADTKTEYDVPSSKDGKDREDDSAAAASDGAEGGRTCVACRKSKVKCSRGSPCQRCSRLKLECVAQIRGRGRPVANSSSKKTAVKSEEKSGGSVGLVGVGAASSGSSAVRAARTGDTSHSSAGSCSSGVPGRVSSTGTGMFSTALAVLPAGCNGVGGGGGSRGSQQGDSRAGSAGSFALSHDFPAGTAAATARDGSSLTPAPLGFGGHLPGRGLSAADSGDDLVGGGVVYGHQQFDAASSRLFQPNLLTAERPPHQQHEQQQHQHQQHSGGYGKNPAERSFFHPLVHGGSGSSDGSDGATLLAPNAPRRGSISSGGSWRAVFHGGGKSIGPGSSFGEVGGGTDIDNYALAGGQCEFMNAPLASTTRAHGGGGGGLDAAAADSSMSETMGYRTSIAGGSGDGDERGGSGSGRGGGSNGGKGRRSSVSSDGGFSSFCGKDLPWAETADEHRDAVNAAAAAAANGDERARWLMDFERATGADPEDRLTEAANGGYADPTDTIVKGFWKLFRDHKVHRPKAVVVIRHWALCALDRRSTGLMRKTVNMARVLGINVAEILNDFGIYAMFHELLREAEAGNTIEPARPTKLGKEEPPPYIRALASSQFAAVSMRVVVRGQSAFFHNDVCARMFLSTQEADDLYNTNKQDVWATCIHPDDHNTFFEDISMELFRAPGHQSEFTKICKCRDKRGTVLLALVHFRYEFKDEGNYAAFGLSMLPLPESKYLRKIEAPAPEAGAGAGENGHDASAAATTSACASVGVGAAVAPATATSSLAQPSSPSLTVQTSARTSTVSSASSSPNPAAGASGAPTSSVGGGGGGGGRGGGAGGGGGDEFLPQALPPLDEVHRLAGSLPLPSLPHPRGGDAWGGGYDPIAAGAPLGGVGVAAGVPESGSARGMARMSGSL